MKSRQPAAKVGMGESNVLWPSIDVSALPQPVTDMTRI